MTPRERHGIVIPLPDVAPSACGGPAFCTVCNAEMIELEQLAIGLAIGHERRRHKGLEVFDPAYVEEAWLRRSYNRKMCRRQAVHLLLVRWKDEGEWRKNNGRKGGRPFSPDRLIADSLGISLKKYQRRRHQERAAELGISGRELSRRLRAKPRRGALLPACGNHEVPPI